MSDVAKFLAKKAARDEAERIAKAQAEGQESEVAQLEEAPVIGAAITYEGVSKAKSPIKESDEPPTPTEAPQAPEHNLSEALTQGAKEASNSRKNDNVAALKSLQDKFALMSGPVLSLVDKEAVKGGVLTLIQKASGKDLLKRHLAANYDKVDANAIANLFFIDPKTTLYKGVDFCPLGGKAGYLNLWAGPTLKPLPGTWLGVEYFLLNIVCGGDKEVYEYLIKYIAHALQKPQHKPGVMLSLLGGQGIGKGTFMKIIMLIWGTTTYKTNRIEDVVGQFNAAIEGKFWLLLDEAQFAGDVKASDALKSIVTESTVSINAKFQPPRMSESLCRVVSATNQVSIGKRDSDDRRDLTLKVSEKHKGDHAYWENLNNCLGQEVAAMMYDLLNMDITLFNVYAKPDTAELTTQKINSLTPEESWWLNCLRDGALPFGSGSSWESFVKTKDIADSITQYRNDLGHRKSYLDPSIQASNLMTKWCESAVKTRAKDSTKRRGYQLPTLEEARQDFEAVLGGKVDWEE